VLDFSGPTAHRFGAWAFGHFVSGRQVVRY
jgi:hypothetical protein